jgi:RND family efflux transporter MFP subunit
MSFFWGFFMTIRYLKWLGQAMICLTGWLLLSSQAYSLPNVHTIQVKSTFVAQHLDAQGTIEARHDVVLSTQQTGTIAKIYFHNGEFVKKGAPLYALNSNELHAQLTQAKAQAQLSQLQLRRMQALMQHTTGSISQSTLDKARATYQQNAAQVNYYEVQIDQRTIRAPFEGSTGKSLVSLGSYVEPGDHLVRLLSNLNLTANYTLPSEDRAALKLNQAVMIKSLQTPQATSQGLLTYISSFVDKSTRTVSLQATLKQSQGFMPGQFVVIMQMINPHKKVIKLPVGALLTGLQGPYVFVVHNHKAHIRFIKADINGAYAFVSKGLKDGEIIVTAGQSGLHNGSLL